MWSEINEWLARARRLVPAEDRKILLSPPRLAVRFARFMMRRALGQAGSAPADELGARDPELMRLLYDAGQLLARYYFRLRVEGVDHVPAHGPVLLVGNHSGGLVPSEGFFMAGALTDRFGPDRAMYALGHDFLFDDPTLRRYAGRLGILRAGHGSAHRALAAGHCVLVFPGSDMDTFRPFRDRNKIVLAGRTGFIKLALREGVPIVPVVTAGTHEQMIVVARGERLARLLHAHSWARTEVLPLMLALPWGLTTGFLPYLPLPAQTTVSFLPAMCWPALGPDAAERPDDVARCYREVEAVMQTELDRLARDRRLLRGPRNAAPAWIPAPRGVTTIASTPDAPTGDVIPFDRGAAVEPTKEATP